MKAMVLAAGRGTRLAPLTGVVPKPMAPILGKPMIGHVFDLLSRTGVDEIHVNVHHLADVVLDHFGAEAQVGGARVLFHREGELMGTAGGVKRLADRFDSTFVVVMGDALTDIGVRRIVELHEQKGAVATLALAPAEDTREYGVAVLDEGERVVGFQEKPGPEEALSNLANTGIYVLEPRALDYVPEGAFFDFASDLFPALLAAGERVAGYDAGGFYWSDVGTLPAYRKAQRDALAGLVRVEVPGARRVEGLWLGRGARVHPSVRRPVGRAFVGGGAEVGPGVRLSRGAAVGHGCRVGGGAVLEGSVLLPGAVVGRGARLEDCVVGPGCRVRAGTRLRGATLVGAPDRRYAEAGVAS